MNLSYEKHDFPPGSLYFHQEASIWTSLTPLYWTIGVTLEKLCLQASVFREMGEGCWICVSFK